MHSCGFSDWAAGVMGELVVEGVNATTAASGSCLNGNLVQFHPERPSVIIHCNCKGYARYFSHVSLPIRYSTVLQNARSTGMMMPTGKSLSVPNVGEVLNREAWQGHVARNSLSNAVQVHFFGKACETGHQRLDSAAAGLGAIRVRLPSRAELCRSNRIACESRIFYKKRPVHRARTDEHKKERSKMRLFKGWRAVKFNESRWITPSTQDTLPSALVSRPSTMAARHESASRRDQRFSGQATDNSNGRSLAATRKDETSTRGKWPAKDSQKPIRCWHLSRQRLTTDTPLATEFALWAPLGKTWRAAVPQLKAWDDVRQGLVTLQEKFRQIARDKRLLSDSDLSILKSAAPVRTKLQEPSSLAERFVNQLVGTNLTDKQLDLLAKRQQRLRTYPSLAGKRVLEYNVRFTVEPSSTDAEDWTHGELPKAAHALGVELHGVLLLNEKMSQVMPSLLDDNGWREDKLRSPHIVAMISALQQTLSQYTTLFVCDSSTVHAPRMSRNESMSMLAGWLKRGGWGAYDGVVTWGGFQVVHADILASKLGVPASRRYTGKYAVDESQKIRIRQLLANAGAAGAVPFQAMRSSVELERVHAELVASSKHRSSGRICFPCFLKVERHKGGTSGWGFHHSNVTNERQVFSGKLITATELLKAGRKMLKEVRGKPLILERFLNGPLIWAETIVVDAAVYRCSFRLMRGRTGVTAPARLDASDELACRRVVDDAVHALDLQSGVFGVQLIVDRRGRSNCSFLEINMRPHGIPLLHDPDFQLYFSDGWRYGVVALLLATGSSHLLPEVMTDHVATPPPFQLARKCSIVPETFQSMVLQHYRKIPDCTMRLAPLLENSQAFASKQLQPSRRLGTPQQAGDGAATTCGARQRVVIIGDVHGCTAELTELLSKIAPQRRCEDRVLFLGDVLGKGPDPIGALRLVRQTIDRLPGSEMIGGNHEHMLLRGYEKARSEGILLRHARDDALHIAANLTQEEFGWLRARPYVVALPEHGVLAVHAGLRSNLHLGQQEPGDMLWMRSLLPNGIPSKVAGKTSWAAWWPGPDHVVFGHDARRKLQMHAFATGIDTGVVYGGHLTALELPGRTLMQVAAKKVYCAPGSDISASASEPSPSFVGRSASPNCLERDAPGARKVALPAHQKSTFAAGCRKPAYLEASQLRTARIIVVSHHKTGTLPAFRFVLQLCCKPPPFGIGWWKWYSNPPGDCLAKCAAAGVAFLCDGLPAEPLLSEINKTATVIHFLREPYSMLTSAYDFHRGCHESWTMAPLSDAVGTYTDRFGAPEIAIAIATLLGANLSTTNTLVSSSYCELLQRAPVRSGVEAETRRSVGSADGVQRMLADHSFLHDPARFRGTVVDACNHELTPEFWSSVARRTGMKQWQLRVLLKALAGLAYHRSKQSHSAKEAKDVLMKHTQDSLRNAGLPWDARTAAFSSFPCSMPTANK